MGSPSRWGAWPQAVMAAPRLVASGAVSRPKRDQKQVRIEASGALWLEHVILEDKIPRICPVIRYVAASVVPDDVVGRGHYPALAACHVSFLRGDEPVHLAAGDVGLVSRRAVGPAVVVVMTVTEGAMAPMSLGIRYARHPPRVVRETPDTVGMGISAEVVVEGAVLLHDDHDMADLVDPPAARVPPHPHTNCSMGGRLRTARRAVHYHDREQDRHS